MAYAAPGYPRHIAGEDDSYYAQYPGYHHQGLPPSEGEQQHPHQEEQELAWYYHQQHQQHQLYLQQQWEEQQRQAQLQMQSAYQRDDYYDEETAIKSEAIEAAYDQFYDDFMRAGPSNPSPPRRGSSALAPITIQDDYAAPDFYDPYQDHLARQHPPYEYQHEQYSAAVPSRPPPRTHHSLPTASSSPFPSSPASQDTRAVRSERSTPLAADSGLSAKLGVKLKRGRKQHRSGQDERPTSDERDLPAQGEEHEVKLNDARQGWCKASVSHTALRDQSSVFDHEDYDGPPISPSTSSPATLLPTPTRKKPGRTRGSRELASINPTPLPLTARKLRNGRVRDRSRESSTSEDSSSEEDREKDRQKEVRHEVYRPQYRLARPYRRRVPGADTEKARTARPAKERSLKTSPPAHDVAASPSAALATTPAWTQPWILSKGEGDEEDNGVPSYPEVHYFVRWMHDAYHARGSAAGQAELKDKWRLSSMPPSSQEEASKQRFTSHEESTATGNAEKKKRDVQDDEDDAAVACLLLPEKDGRTARGKTETSPVRESTSASHSPPPVAHGMHTPSPPTTSTPTPPPATSVAAAAAAATSPSTPSPLWLATIATRISILDTPEALLPTRGTRGTQQDYPLLLRGQFAARLGLASAGGDGRVMRDREASESDKAGSAPAGPLEDLSDVSATLPCPAASLGGAAGRRGACRPAALQTKPLWEHLVRRYRLRRAEGRSHDEALWSGPPLGARKEEEEEEEGGEEEGKREGRKAPLILRRNLPREVRGSLRRSWQGGGEGC